MNQEHFFFLRFQFYKPVRKNISPYHSHFPLSRETTFSSYSVLKKKNLLLPAIFQIGKQFVEVLDEGLNFDNCSKRTCKAI